MSFLSSLFSAATGNGASNVAPNVYLQCNGSRLQFPVAPSSFEVSVKQNNSTVNINNIGELNMIGKTGLATMSLSSFFPNQQYTFCACTPSVPYDYVKKIDSWRTSGKPCRFIVSGTPVNYAVTIETFKWGEHDGSGDVYFSIDFKEYKFVGNAKDTTQFNALSGMKDRPQPSFLENVLDNVTVYPSDSISDVLGRSIGKTAAMGDNNKNLLAAYKNIAKGGGLKTGSIISYSAGAIKKVQQR